MSDHVHTERDSGDQEYDHHENAHDFLCLIVVSHGRTSVLMISARSDEYHPALCSVLLFKSRNDFSQESKDSASSDTSQKS